MLLFRTQKGSDMETESMFSASGVNPVSEIRPSVPSYKKKNNIWGSVLTEQDLTQTLVQSAAVDKPSELSYNERNVESYDFTKRYIDTRPELEDSDLPKPEVKHDPFEKVVSRAQASGSSRARQIIDYEDALAKPKEHYDRSQEVQRMSRKRKSDNSSDRQQRSGIHDRLGVKKVTTTQLGDINISVDMESEELSKKIADFLHEPKVEIIGMCFIPKQSLCPFGAGKNSKTQIGVCHWAGINIHVSSSFRFKFTFSY